MDKVLTNIFENLLVQIGALQLEHVLHQVVSVGIFDQVSYLLDNLPGKLDLLRGTALLQTPLDHTTAMLLLADFYAVGDARIEDELGVLLELLTARCIGV